MIHCKNVKFSHNLHLYASVSGTYSTEQYKMYRFFIFYIMYYYYSLYYILSLFFFFYALNPTTLFCVLKWLDPTI